MSPSLFKQDSSDANAQTPTRERTSIDPAERSRRKTRDQHATISVLGVGIEVNGEIKARGDIQIEGRVKGNLSVEGQVSIASGGTVEGDVSADRVIVAGHVEGSIDARESARLVEGAQVDADISSPRLELEDGATLNGRVDMGGQAKSSNKSKPTSQDSSEEPRKQDVA